ncbi:MAG: PIN domain-containing protein [Balneolaceae bacterium]
MNILFDINILLDAFLERHTFVEHSAYLIDLAEKRIISGWLGATTITTIYYLLAKELGKKEADVITQSLFNIFDITSVNRTVLETALGIDFPDYEDAVLHQSAFHSNLDGILTRNGQDFRNSKLPVYTPQELIAALEA